MMQNRLSDYAVSGKLINEDTVIKKYTDENDLYHIEKYSGETLLEEQIYHKGILAYKSPLKLSEIVRPVITLSGAKKYIELVDTVEVHNIPVMNRSVTSIGAFVSKINDSSYLIQVSKQGVINRKVRLYVHVSYFVNGNSSVSYIADSLLLNIQ